MLQVVPDKGEADVQSRSGRSAEIYKGPEQREALAEAGELVLEKQG